MRRAVWWVAGIAAAAGLSAGAWLSRPATPPLPSMSTPSAPLKAATPVQGVRVGKLMPSFTLPDLDGMPVKFPDQFKGKPLLINVWASWCAPCIEEMPELARFAARHADTGPQVVGLALDTPEAVLDFLGNVPVYYPIVIETPGPQDASVKLGNSQGLLPYSVLVDAQGRVLKQKLGPFKVGEIDAWVAGVEPAAKQ
ncbi:TlpA disulfide reductase family protein [uncultured Stenotrophomonas sp.]|uniref:TlpA family protein disulfide reductase n=1 Tax=uncultured Stenotrophomonas sp. TaxID=165438 RepID=UPI0025E18FCD|nr:TlpA disulfide reductase family protein [uncultured Stenotrophomonas sp.]